MILGTAFRRPSHERVRSGHGPICPHGLSVKSLCADRLPTWPLVIDFDPCYCCYSPSYFYLSRKPLKVAWLPFEWFELPAAIKAPVSQGLGPKDLIGAAGSIGGGSCYI